jgi:hypothetical protein
VTTANQSKTGSNSNLCPIRRQNRPLFEVPMSLIHVEKEKGPRGSKPEGDHAQVAAPCRGAATLTHSDAPGTRAGPGLEADVGVVGRVRRGGGGACG